MKTKLLLTAALIGVTSLSAHAGIRFGLSFGLPLPVPVVVTAPAAPVVVATPACPEPGYVWAPGYWSVSGYSRVWVPAGWRYRPEHIAYAHSHGWYRY